MAAAMTRFLLAVLVCLCGAGPAVAADETDTAAKPAPKPLVYPNGLALDGDGSLFISDIGTHQVVKLARDGNLSLVAGTGEAGFSGDGGPATQAQLAAPMDLTFDADGNLLVADTFNHRVRRIDRAGVITTIVGNGKSSPPRDGPALEVSLNNPQSLALDRDGNLYIADTYNHVVRKVDTKGTVTTFAGTEAGLAGDGGPAIKAQLNLPQAVAVGPDGLVYVSDSANSRIRRVGADGVIQTISGSGLGSGEGGAGFAGDGGPPEKAKLFSPGDLNFNAVGQLYFVDSGNNRVRAIVHGIVLTIAGN